MNCDNVIHEKLLEYPMVKDTFSTSHFTIIVGKMGQGKTSLAVSLIKNVFKKCFENIYIFIPSSSRSSIDNDIFGKNLPEDQLYDDLSVSNLEELYEKLKSNTALEENSLVLVDDFQSVYKDKDVSKRIGDYNY
jgi:DNA replication protein DnaC